MNTIEEQLTSAMHRRDAELTVHDELDSILNDDHIVRFTLQRAPHTRRPLLLTAAAATMLIVGAGSLIWAQRTELVPPATAESSRPSDGSTGQETAPATTVLQITPPGTIAADASACSDGEAETTVPNVGGMAYSDAVEALRGVGLDAQVGREAVGGGIEPELGDGHVIVWQDPTAGQPIACGSVVELTATTLPVYVSEPGDTWASIAAAQGIAVEDLLESNYSTIAELEADGRSAESPVETGRVIRLSLPNRTLGNGPPATTIAPPTSG